MNLTELQHQVEDKAVEYLNEVRLDALEETALYQLNKSANNGYVRLHKLEFSALLNAVRGLHRKYKVFDISADPQINDIMRKDRTIIALNEEYRTLRDSYDKLFERHQKLCDVHNACLRER